MKFLGAEGGPVYAVLSYPSAAHDNGVPGPGPLLPGLSPVYFHGHDATCAAEYQGFSQVAFIKEYASVDSRDAALVSSVFHPFTYALEYPLGVQQSLGKRLVVVRRAEAEDIGVEYKLGTKTSAEGVPVDSHNAGKGSAVGVKGRGAVVGLYLEGNIQLVVESYHPGIVLKNGKTPVILSQFFPDDTCGPADICIEQAVDFLPAPRCFICDACIEYLVLAMLRPGLGQGLEFAVSVTCPKACLLSVFYYFFFLEMGLEAFHLVQVQYQHPLPGKCH